MLFLLKECLKTFFLPQTKDRVGFILDVPPLPYSLVMASTRMRVYDIILSFSDTSHFLLELYRPWRRYDIVVFQKAFRKKHFALAQTLSKKGVKIILDLNTTVFEHNQDVQAFVKLTDHLLVSSRYLLNSAQKTFPNHPVSLIEEHIPNDIFSVEKNTDPLPTTLVYAGYAQKASEVLFIERVLKSFRKRHPFSILFLCEKDPHISIDGIECVFIRYQQSKIRTQLTQGDIFIAPRNLTDTTNYGHSFSKIGLPMAMGLPVLASPVPAYLGSPAILCATEEAWEHNLELLFTDPQKRRSLARQGRQYCQDHYSTKQIILGYETLFRLLIDKIPNNPLGKEGE